jgi:hypothetical protein
MDSWKTTLYEQFAGNRQVLSRYYRVDKFFITYKRFNVWFEMRFEHNLN